MSRHAQRSVEPAQIPAPSTSPTPTASSHTPVTPPAEQVAVPSQYPSRRELRLREAERMRAGEGVSASVPEQSREALVLPTPVLSGYVNPVLTEPEESAAAPAVVAPLVASTVAEGTKPAVVVPEHTDPVPSSVTVSDVPVSPIPAASAPVQAILPPPLLPDTSVPNLQDVPGPILFEPTAAHLPPLLGGHTAYERHIAAPSPHAVNLALHSRTSGPRRARTKRSLRPGSRLAIMALAAGFVLPAALPAYAFDPVIVASNAITAESTAEVTKLNQQYLAIQQGVSVDDAGTTELALSREDVTSEAQTVAGTASITACRITDATTTNEVVFPLPGGSYYLSSGIGYRYISSIRWSDYHTGQDFASAYGVSVLSATSGTVTEVGQALGATYVKVRSELSTGEVVDLYYLHMYSNQVWVKAGDTVHAGEEIALVGSSGVSTGPHLHFEVHDASLGDTTVAERATLIDPEPWLEAHDARSVGFC